MRPFNEITVNYMRGGTAIGSGGTLNSVGVDWKPYTAGVVAIVSVGATPTGTLIYRLCGGTATGDVATVFAAGTALPGAGGTLTGSLVADITTEYANVQLISTGGTVLASAELLGQKRYLTT